MGLLDAALAQRGVTQQDVLAEINQLLDWSTFERLLLVIPTAAKGEPSYPALMMFKVLLLQRWYGLSDPAMEAALFEAARKLLDESSRSAERPSGEANGDSRPFTSATGRRRRRVSGVAAALRVGS